MAQKKAPAITVELSPAERGAYNAWVAAKAAKDAAEDAMSAAADVLRPAFVNGATVATIGKLPVLRLVESSRVTFDRETLERLAPKAAEKARKVSAFDYLRKA